MPDGSDHDQSEEPHIIQSHIRVLQQQPFRKLSPNTCLTSGLTARATIMEMKQRSPWSRIRINLESQKVGRRISLRRGSVYAGDIGETRRGAKAGAKRQQKHYTAFQKHYAAFLQHYTASLLHSYMTKSIPFVASLLASQCSLAH